MVKEYLQLVSSFHKNNPASCVGDPTNYDNIVWHGESVSKETLDADFFTFSKLIRYNEIDYKTGTLIAAGFSFADLRFSLSFNAQINWNTLKMAPETFTWPVEITCANNNAYELAQDDLQTFWNAAKNTVKGYLDLGRILKKQVYDATTLEEIEAVTDTRTAA